MNTKLMLLFLLSCGFVFAADLKKEEPSPDSEAPAIFATFPQLHDENKLRVLLMASHGDTIFEKLQNMAKFKRLDKATSLLVSNPKNLIWLFKTMASPEEESLGESIFKDYDICMQYFGTLQNEKPTNSVFAFLGEDLDLWRRAHNTRIIDADNIFENLGAHIKSLTPGAHVAVWRLYVENHPLQDRVNAPSWLHDSCYALMEGDMKPVLDFKTTTEFFVWVTERFTIESYFTVSYLHGHFMNVFTYVTSNENALRDLAIEESLYTRAAELHTELTVDTILP